MVANTYRPDHLISVNGDLDRNKLSRIKVEFLSIDSDSGIRDTGMPFCCTIDGYVAAASVVVMARRGFCL